MPMARQYWTTRLGRPEDTPAILDLVRTVYADRASLNRDYWEWRYLSAPEFHADTVMAEHEGRPIGIQPVAVFDFQQGEDRLKGAMYTGALTHPAHRRRGIFRSLVTGANERAAQRGAQFSMTMPNDESLAAFLRFGEWESPGLIPLYLKVADGPALLRPRLGRVAAALTGRLPQLPFRARHDTGHSPPLDHKQVSCAPDELDDVFDAFARDSKSLMIRRTAAYWNWRYAARPGAPYCMLVVRRAGRIVGAAVTSVQRRMGVDIGMVLDLVARGGVPSLRCLLREAEKTLVSRGVGLVTCQATSSLLRCALQEAGFRCPEPAWLPKRFHFVYRMTGVPGLRDRPARLGDWHLTFGDSDNV